VRAVGIGCLSAECSVARQHARGLLSAVLHRLAAATTTGSPSLAKGFSVPKGGKANPGQMACRYKGVCPAMLASIAFTLSMHLDASSGELPMAHEFFSERADQSEVKARIVSNYFDAWARIIAPRTMQSDGRIAYVDLFAGPGRYEDGSASTPLMVLAKAIANPKLREALVSLFNDHDEEHTRTLEQEIARLAGVETLTHKPAVYTGDIDVPQPSILRAAD
jgi:hypothetical protein